MGPQARQHRNRVGWHYTRLWTLSTEQDGSGQREVADLRQRVTSGSHDKKLAAGRTAEVGLAAIPACGATDLGEGDTDDLGGEDSQSDAQEGEDVAEAEQALCPLELVEPCIANVAICAVRCCDDALFKSVQVCGYCGAWASDACANHGSRKRIRWEPL
jgi:hypothetical protein